MKKLIQQGCTVLVMFTIASCSSTVYQAGRQTKTVVIDGIPTEWQLPLRFSDSESGLQYTVTNDEINIYICFRANEQALQAKILHSGMEIGLYPPGKYKEASLILFPLPASHKRNDAPGNQKPGIIQGRNPEKTNLSELFQLEDQQLILSGFQPGYNGTFLARDTNDIKAAINWDMISSMTYELVIPIKSLLSNNIASLTENPVIGFKLTIGALTDQGSGPGGSMMQGGHPEGRGGQPPSGSQGGGQGGGMGRGSGGGMGEMSQPPDGQTSNESGSTTSVKFKFKLNGLMPE